MYDCYIVYPYRFYSFFNLGARWGWVANTTPRPLYPKERYPVPILEEVGWVSETVWTGGQNLARNRF